jgi:hypothetical protein
MNSSLAGGGEFDRHEVPWNLDIFKTPSGEALRWAMVFVPEEKHDRSHARSAWNPEENNPSQRDD